MIAALGFAGLRVKNGVIELHPHLPKQITRLSFRLAVGGVIYEVTVTHDDHIVQKV